jgi:hypothetical protein
VSREAVPNCLVVHPEFVRVNGPDGKAVARASATVRGTWLVRSAPGADVVEMSEPAALAAMRAAALVFALTA